MSEKELKKEIERLESERNMWRIVSQQREDTIKQLKLELRETREWIDCMIELNDAMEEDMKRLRKGD